MKEVDLFSVKVIGIKRKRIPRSGIFGVCQYRSPLCLEYKVIDTDEVERESSFISLDMDWIKPAFHGPAKWSSSYDGWFQIKYCEDGKHKIVMGGPNETYTIHELVIAAVQSVLVENYLIK